MPEGSDHIGKRLRELDETADKTDVAILGLIRDGKRRYGRAATTRLQAGDALVLEAAPDALDEFRAALSLDFSDAKRQEQLTAAGEGLEVIEVVVPETARIDGKTAQALGLAWRQRTILMGISREGETHHGARCARPRCAPATSCCCCCPKGRGADVTDWLGCLPLAERGLSVTADDKVWLAIGLFAVAVAAASFGLLYLPIALGLVVIGYVLTRILPLTDIYNHVEWPVVVLLGSMIPLGGGAGDLGRHRADRRGAGRADRGRCRPG